MKLRGAYQLPDDKRVQQRRAVHLEWATLFFMATIITVMYFAMGASQAMKAAWVEDLLSLVPPIAFLVAMRYRHRAPNERFPYGYQRSISIAFLVAAIALFLFGLFILFDSVMKLVMKEHPTIGTMQLFGRDLWSGWVMIAVLTYSAVPPIILGRMKLPLATELHDKALHTDAQMNKADWMTAGAGILGILGVGIGWWWADAVAAGLISLDIVKDGASSLKNVIEDLMDRKPMTVDHNQPDDIPTRMAAELLRLDWVRGAEVRLREEGHVLNGEAFVVPVDEADPVSRVEEATRVATLIDWRVQDVVVTLVRSLDHPPAVPGRGGEA